MVFIHINILIHNQNVPNNETLKENTLLAYSLFVIFKLSISTCLFFGTEENSPNIKIHDHYFKYRNHS